MIKVVLIYIVAASTVFANGRQLRFPDLSKLTSRAELNALIASTEITFKQVLSDNAAAILAAAKQHRHVEAVIRTIESSPGTFIKINTTPDALKRVAGGDLVIFDTLTQVNTSILGGKAHVYRSVKDDPYDAVFIEHLGHIPTLESVKIVATSIEDAWLAPLLKLTNLKTLSIEGGGKLGDVSLAQLQHLAGFSKLVSLELAYFGKATDSGLELLAGLKNLERFTFRGSLIQGHAFAKFEGWDKLKTINFHSNRLDDEGLGYVCERFPNLEFIKLWHSHDLTDSGAEHLQKLRKLKGIEISCKQASAALLKYMHQLPIEYVGLGYGVNIPVSEAIANMKSIPTLRRLSIESGALADADLNRLATIANLEDLSFENLELPDARLSQLRLFAYLKTLTLAFRPKGYPVETEVRIRELLPEVAIKFVK